MTVEEVDALWGVGAGDGWEHGPAVGWASRRRFSAMLILVGLAVPRPRGEKTVTKRAPNDESREMYKIPALLFFPPPLP